MFNEFYFHSRHIKYLICVLLMFQEVTGISVMRAITHFLTESKQTPGPFSCQLLTKRVANDILSCGWLHIGRIWNSPLPCEQRSWSKWNYDICLPHFSYASDLKRKKKELPDNRTFIIAGKGIILCLHIQPKSWAWEQPFLHNRWQCTAITFLWPLLLTWFNFNPSMDK